MAITPEMKEKMNQEHELRVRYGRSAAEKENAMLAAGKAPSADPRVTVEFHLGESQEEIDKYQNKYLSENPAEREPYVKVFFDYLVNYRLEADLADTEEAEKNILSLHGARGKFCYTQNLLENNSKYFEDFYTPTDLRKINITQDYFTATTPSMDLILADNGYDSGLKNETPKIRPCKNFEGALLAQSAGFLYKQSMDALDGKPLDTSMSIKVQQDAGRGIFSLDTMLKNNQPQTRSAPFNSAQDIFNNVFVAPYSFGCQAAERKAMGVDIYDMIYIDGVSANEAFSQKYPSNTPGREALMKAEVINAMASGKNRLELATIQRDKDNQPKLVVNAVKPDLKAIEPSIKQDYSRIRRAFNFGPFKLKTRTEKIDALWTSDKEKTSRQNAIAQKMEGKLQALKTDDADKKKQKDLIKEAKNEKAHNIMKDKTFGSYDDKAYFKNVDLPEGLEKDNYQQYFSKNDAEFAKCVQTMNRPFSRRSLVDFVMLSKGYSIDDLMNNKSEQYTEALADAGKEAVDMMVNKDTGKLAQVFTKSGQVLANTPVALVNPNDPEAVVAAYDFSVRHAFLCKDWEQLQAPSLKEAMVDLNGEEKNQKINSAVVLTGLIQHQVKTVGDYYRDPVSSQPNPQYSVNSMTHMSSKITLDNFRSQQKTRSINTFDMDTKDLIESKYHLVASIEGSMAFLSEQNKIASDRKNPNRSTPLMNAYMKGTGPNPLHVDKQGTVFQGDRVIKTVNDIKKVEKRMTDEKVKSAAAPETKARQKADLSSSASKTQAEQKKQADSRSRGR